MHERVIYSIFENGSDVAALAGLIEALVAAGLLTLLAIRLRHAKESGRPLVGRNALLTTIGNFLADHATLAIVAICCLAFAVAFHLWTRYRADRAAFASGSYQTVVGTLDAYRVAGVTRYRHRTRLW